MVLNINSLSLIPKCHLHLLLAYPILHLIVCPQLHGSTWISKRMSRKKNICKTSITKYTFVSFNSQIHMQLKNKKKKNGKKKNCFVLNQKSCREIYVFLQILDRIELKPLESLFQKMKSSPHNTIQLK